MTQADESLTALVLPKSRVRALEYASEQELESPDRTVGFSARVWAQVSLPYSKPAPELQYWERKNGDVTLTLRPALLTEPDGSKVNGYPFGVLPRHALTWMATEAVLTESPQLELGRSMNAFMKKISLPHGGSDAKRLTDQLQRLFGSQLSVEGLAVNATGRGSVTKYFQIADTVQLWFNNSNELDNDGLWASEVTLSNQFYRSIVDAPVPIDMDAIKALGSSAFRLDIYLWLTYRMFSLNRITRIPWQDLNDQFGAQYSRDRAFKTAFVKLLKDVLIVYPEAKVEVTDAFLILRPSPTHIPTTKPRRKILK